MTMFSRYARHVIIDRDHVIKASPLPLVGEVQWGGGGGGGWGSVPPSRREHGMAPPTPCFLLYMKGAWSVEGPLHTPCYKQESRFK